MSFFNKMEPSKTNRLLLPLTVSDALLEEAQAVVERSTELININRARRE
jgi:hypothetical protein